MKLSEKIVENEILHYLALRQVFAFKVKTVGTFDPIRKKFRRSAANYKKGVADILGIYQGKFLAIEVKRPEARDDAGKIIQRAGTLSNHQRAFLEDVKAQGGIAVVARSWGDVDTALFKAQKAS